MESSDDSFAWADASSDSGNEIEYKVKSKQDPDESMVQKKSNRKLLQVNEVENEIVIDNIQTKKSIKSETYNDLNTPKKSKKHKWETNTVNNSNNSSSENEDYLNLRVKQEEAGFIEPTPTKSKKKKKYKNESITNEDQDFELNALSKNEMDVEEPNLDSSDFTHHDPSEIVEIDTSYRKKKKKKKQKLSIGNDNSEILDNSGGNYETTTQSFEKNGSDDCQLQDVGNESSTLIDNFGQNNEPSDTEVQSISKLVNGLESKNKKSIAKACRISDRITFEEDSIDFEVTDNVSKTDMSIHLKEFITSNINLKPLQINLNKSPMINEDDEIWLLKGPHEISIEDLENTKLSLDCKKKVKINGKTFDSIIDTSNCAVPVVLYNKNRVFLKNISVTGVINLRKRIPKVQIVYESLITHNDGSFIPLPETKCRHPLFGIDYRKTTKIPKKIAERLSALHGSINIKEKKQKIKEKVEIDSDCEKPYVKAHFIKQKKSNTETLKDDSEFEEKSIIDVSFSNKKKKKKERVDFDTDYEVTPNIEIIKSKKRKRKIKEVVETESEIDVKPDIDMLDKEKNEMKDEEKEKDRKKRKRKHSEEKYSKAKRIKKETSTAESWETALAVEKNLFDS